MRHYRDPRLTQPVYGSVVRRISDLLAAGRRGVNVKIGFYFPGCDHVVEDALRHGGTADVAVADE